MYIINKRTNCKLMKSTEGDDHDVLSDLVAFEFHPGNVENPLVDDSCTVKCRVYNYCSNM